MKTTIVYHQPVLCIPPLVQAAQGAAYPTASSCPAASACAQPSASWHVVASTDFVHLTGLCSKLGFWVSNWKRRWFVLDGSYLTYYTPNRKHQKGMILLSNILNVHEAGSELRVVTKFRTYRLRVPAEVGGTMPWARALQHNLRARCLRNGTRPAEPLFRALVYAAPAC